ncbi:unnamed protein product, partial [Staurois parvus]
GDIVCVWSVVQSGSREGFPPSGDIGVCGRLYNPGVGKVSPHQVTLVCVGSVVQSGSREGFPPSGDIGVCVVGCTIRESGRFPPIR